MSNYKLISVWALAVNVADSWSANWESEKLHGTNFVLNSPKIDAKSRRWP